MIYLLSYKGNIQFYFLKTMNLDILQEVFDKCNIDTKINFRKAFPEYELKNKKLDTDNIIIVQPWKQYDKKQPCFYDIEICSPTEYVDWYTAYWASYRCIKITCKLCFGTSYSMFTCNQSDIYIPGYYYISPKKYIQFPWFANNWLGKLCDGNCDHCKVR